jgi:alpha-D-xyloside xylohydrolase
MDTRILESKDVVRYTISEVELLKAETDSLLFKTTACRMVLDTVPVAGRVHFRQASPGNVVEGRLQVDLLSDSIVRVRYKEGKFVPENKTAMVVGTFTRRPGAEISQEASRVVAATDANRLTVHLHPFSMEIHKRSGERIGGIGGREKNHFQVWDSYNTGICRTKETGAPIAVECFDLEPHEAIYGFGEKFIRLNKTGQTVDLDMRESLGTTTPRSYKNIPFFVSTNGYGVFFNHSCRMTCWVGSMIAANVQMALDDDFLDYYIITGSIKEILSQYTDITGKGALPPLWTFGFWQSKISYFSAGQTLEIAQKLRELEVPCDVIHLDTFWFKEDWRCDLEFDKDRFPDPEGMFAELAKLGFKVSLWQLPYIPEGSRLFDELKEAGAFIRNHSGEMYDHGLCITPGFKGAVGCIDYTNPRAVEIHKKWIGRLLKMGAKVIKVDFGEDAPSDGVYYDGTPGHQAHNLYPLLYNKIMAEVTKEVAGHSTIWARSAWAGSQRYPLHWGGDNSANWANIIPQLEGGLSFGLSGFQFWSQDIGGFIWETEDRLLTRWMQFGCFLSHSRIHGFGDREIYSFGPDTFRICRDYIRLRYRLLPYIYGSAIACVERSLPMARALVIEYQDDPNVWNIGNEYLFGDSLLVAPITDETDRRWVYLPKGVWTDWWTGERLRGERWIQVEADIETLPLYIREGGIVPMGPVMNYVGERPTDAVDVRIAPFESNGQSSFIAPVDDERVPIEYTASHGTHMVKIGRSRARFTVEVIGADKNSVGMIRK